MALKVPPPPKMASQDQAFNRWLIELTSILNDQGLIDPSQIAGFGQSIAALTAALADLQIQINILNTQVTAQNAVYNSAILALQLRAQVTSGIIAPVAADGVVGDWYADTVAKHIYVKTAAATWTLIV